MGDHEGVASPFPVLGLLFQGQFQRKFRIPAVAEQPGFQRVGVDDFHPRELHCMRCLVMSLQHHVPMNARSGEPGTPIPSELVTGFAHKRADLLPEGFGLVACGQRHPKRVQPALSFLGGGEERHPQAVGVKQLKRRSGPGPVGVVCVQDRRAVDLDRREHIQALKFEGGRIGGCPSMWTDERRRVRPRGVLHPLHVPFVRASVGVGREPRAHQIFQHESRHLGSHRVAAFNPNVPRRTECGERHAVGRRGRAGHEKGKRAAGPQGPIAAHAQKLNGV